ncbi:MULTISPECIES: XdhC/CoxI family protein [unclassified Fusibacter]|uniref:XdhC family protein n=1 Tax=unclassified Fusibacter TaxID=2624464 RepID=UPI00101130E8|nr:MULTISPECIES: XdhC/CoxI family protein [unclassified Fusibacter]MCK8058544.1 XdhC family protein [Fusibacter sp. A2]NPE22687.1 xanthine dehydrogenase [Fusibacter sp. A1]RXV60248.1 xanthine dehydrogenase [Fusibacter sp. A1]
MKNKIYEQLNQNLNKGKRCVVFTVLDFIDDTGGRISHKELIVENELTSGMGGHSENYRHAVVEALDTGKMRFDRISRTSAVLIEPFLPKPRLIIFGGGHISLPLVEFATKVGFSCVVFDDRPFFANKQRFLEADQVICEAFDKLTDTIEFRSSDYVVLVTRGHRYDRDILRKMLKIDLCYLGMIGSKRRVAGMKEQLLLEGADKARLERLMSPIGIEIGAVSPEEIAVAITAQLIAVKNRFGTKHFDKQVEVVTFKEQIAKQLNDEAAMPKALLTIISTKGSVPRKAGAKMVAYYDGRTFGTIGGGCSESDVIAKARDRMLERGFFVESIRMTGEVAEDEGMVCGGIMDVLVEVF